MNLLPWMMLVFLLSAGTNLADVDVNWLAGIVEAITTHVRSQYGITGQYFLATNIPLNQDPNTLYKILPKNDVGDLVQRRNRVMTSTKMVIARPRETSGEHADPRVLKDLDKLKLNSQGNFLLIYSYLSPCSTRCANPQHKDNILKYFINYALSSWNHNYAFVFKKVFDQPQGYPVPREQLIEALQHLGNSGLGLRNIYRCFKPEQSTFQCYSCSLQKTVSEVCVNNNFEPGQEGNDNNVISGNSRGGGASSSNTGQSRGASRSNTGQSRGGFRSRV